MRELEIAESIARERDMSVVERARFRARAIDAIDRGELEI